MLWLLADKDTNVIRSFYDQYFQTKHSSLPQEVYDVVSIIDHNIAVVMFLSRDIIIPVLAIVSYVFLYFYSNTELLLSLTHVYYR